MEVRTVAQMHKVMRRAGHPNMMGLALCLIAVPALAVPDNTVSVRQVEVAAPATPDPLLAKADAELRSTLVSRGYVIAPVASFRIEMAWSRRPNDVGLKSNARGDGFHVDAKPGRKRVDLCTDDIHRVVVAKVENQTGAVVYRGSSEMRRCGPLSNKDLKAMVGRSLAGMP